jgi:transposase-like protein
MRKSVLTQPHYNSEIEAYRFVEARLWPNGPVCFHCGDTKRVSAMKGKTTRIGLYKCYACRKPFNVKLGTIFEASHVPMHLWLQAIFLMCSSKKGVSANQLHRTLGVQLKTGWFIGHRIREAMHAGSLAPLGGSGNIVEVDETFIGRKSGQRKRHAYQHKHVVLTLVDRAQKQARSFHVEKATADNIIPVVKANIGRETVIASDEAKYYSRIKDHFAGHETVKHVDNEWARGPIHTNTVENFFSVFKRGMRGTYQHCSEKHLHRYLREFDFRYNARIALGVDDEARADKALGGVVGRRLLYRDSC